MPKPMAPDNGATFLWRHAVDRRFGAAVDNTRRCCRHPIPAPPFRPLPFPCFARVRGTPMVSLGCGHRRATERSGLYQTQPLNLPFGAPRRRFNLYGFRLGSRTWVWCLPRTLTSAVRIRTRPSTFLLLVGQEKSSEPSAYTVVGFGKEDAPSSRAFDLRWSAQSPRGGAQVLIGRFPQPMLRMLLLPHNPSVEETQYAEA